MDLIKTVSKILKREVTEQEAKDFALNQYGVLASFIRTSTPMENWTEQLIPIIDEFKDGSDEPLDGDEVDGLVKIIQAKINLQEGNITPDEYEEILG
jgi:hypothetical protein